MSSPSTHSGPPKGIQDYIYMLEEGAGPKILQGILFGFLGLVVAVIFLFTEARNFSNPEAMDMAQIGRNIARGKGFSTHYIRPFALHLQREKARQDGVSDAGLLRKTIPDLQYPPVYPTLLAGLFKLTPELYHTSVGKGEAFTNRPPMEIVISIFNLGWLAISAILVYRLGTRMFEAAVGKLAALAFIGTETLWRCATNGLATPFLLFLVLLIFGLLVRLEALGRDVAAPSFRRQLLLACGVGALLGLGCLTSYSFGWLIVPVAGFLLVCGGWRRLSLVPVVVVIFAVAIAPWLYRNVKLSGQPFGTAGYTLYSLTDKLPVDRLERTQQSLQAEQIPNYESFKTKWIKGATETLRNPLPRLGSNWLVALFLAGLMVQFQDVGRRRLHRFTLATVVWLYLLEPFCQTQLSQLVPAINSENVLILVMPLMLIFGSAFAAMLVDAIEWNHLLLRDLGLGLVAFVVSLPLLTSLLPPRQETIVAPLYHPGLVQTLSGFMRKDEMIMSDIPWAVAWYGDRDCVNLSLRVQDDKRKGEEAKGARTLPEDFFQINDFERPINALYLSPLTTEAPMRLFFDYNTDFAWGRFYFDALMRGNLAGRFPLYRTYPGSARSGHLFLTESVRW